MNIGRSNLKQAASEQDFTLEECQSIAKVLSLRGSNQIEIKDARGKKSLALFPAKFRQSMWIRRESDSGSESDSLKLCCHGFHNRVS
ncbi:unnamed protein product [Eruca vesicaria subsp. sativa]|uniref:S1-like domain-containing protein n=1 Tax=Eruca vesicaria subsp. sativa TaxID=29727 RepID=A0ABC8IS64_ERUVS|nr:unnamed protein product [Eruca vesicaria subsp. sativa]